MRQESNLTHYLRTPYALMLGIAGALIVALSLAFSGFGSVLAQEVTTPPDPGETPAPMVIESDDVGNVTIRGTVTAVNEDSVTLDSWGGDWTIRATATTGVAASANGASGAGDLSGISVGDFLGAEGTFAADQDMTVDATFVRDWTTDPLEGVFEDQSADIDVMTDTEIVGGTGIGDAATDTADMITYSGTVNRADSSSFTFTDDFNSTYTVSADVSVVNDAGDELSFDDIDPGDTVELDGVASGDTIDTDMVRITSE